MNLGEIIGIILALLVFETFSHFLLAEIFETIFYTPKSIYEESNMNWFGVICVYILIFPFSFILGIGGFLKWLFTVRKNKSIRYEVNKKFKEDLYMFDQPDYYPESDEYCFYFTNDEGDDHYLNFTASELDGFIRYLKDMRRLLPKWAKLEEKKKDKEMEEK